MNRLTARDEHGNAYYLKCFDEPCNVGGCTKNMCDFAVEVCDKLAAYEDTGLDPEQLSVIDEEYSKIAKELAELRKYKCLGTLEEVREAMEKQMAAHPLEMLGIFGEKEYECINCGSTVAHMDKYCKWCGKAQDWSGSK